MSAAGIRPATEADLPAILDIYNHAVLNTTATYDHAPVSLENRQTWLRERQSGGWPVLVATDTAGQVIGWASYGPYRPRLGYSRTVEHSVYLAPEVQGQGIGGRLLAALIDHAREQGLHAMIGVIDADNAASLRFHERYGFFETGRLPQVGHKFGRWLDAAFLVLHLNEDAAPAHGKR